MPEVPDWVDPVMPSRGPCLLCGDGDARHRVLDVIRDRVRVGDGEEDVAEDYGYPVWFVERVAREWPG
jgi:hypothetical protein